MKQLHPITKSESIYAKRAAMTATKPRPAAPEAACRPAAAPAEWVAKLDEADEVAELPDEPVVDEPDEPDEVELPNEKPPVVEDDEPEAELAPEVEAVEVMVELALAIRWQWLVRCPTQLGAYGGTYKWWRSCRRWMGWSWRKRQRW